VKDEGLASDPNALVSLEGKVAMVTGGGGDIGGATASLLMRAGARVACVDLPDRRGPEGAEVLGCDLAEPENVAALLEEFGQRFGRLDVLVHCAGITRDAVLWKMADEDWARVLRVNLDSAFHLLKRAVPLMRAGGGGSIVLISSINALRGRFGQANYTSSKAGLIALGKTAAHETGKFGIRVNVVAPGLTETVMTASMPEDLRKEEIKESALKTIGQPEDVARAVLFLASSMSRHITGQVLRVDGGQLMA
jgi:acetoacetyl-CoA reductase/3-oxoacyl-[acyl-carrier protein] reductase